ncbi:MAG: very short patch repair endonuclease [Chloroflexi bacterium]|nr:very short patch repair endonuclease [Chloroflexota bacterium]
MAERAEDRSRVMRAVKGRDTEPEMVVRRLAHAQGYRYLLHDRRLPGKPDLVFPSRRKVVFVHGCFWHQHDCSRGARTPKSHQDYWIPKLTRNQERDAQHVSTLQGMGWDVLVVWECETRDQDEVGVKLSTFLG